MKRITTSNTAERRAESHAQAIAARRAEQQRQATIVNLKRGSASTLATILRTDARTGHATAVASAHAEEPTMRHGTYDHAGAFHPQLVHLGTTMSGVPGLFTGNTLAWPITRDLFEAFRTDHVGLKAYVERIGFTLQPDSVLDQQDVHEQAQIMHEATERGWFEQQVCREAP